jgi:hypothetical protein
VIFSKHSETHCGESESRHGESVENFDQTVGLSIHDLDCRSSRLIFKPKADLDGYLEFLDFVLFNQPAHFRHFEPVYIAQRLTGFRHGMLVASAKLSSETPTTSIFLYVRSMSLSSSGSFFIIAPLRGSLR